jgi:hypothetical protein
VMQPDHLTLYSAAPAPLPLPAAQNIASAGVSGQGSQRGIRPGVSVPSWLVLGQGYSKGWRAWCTDQAGRERALGPPTLLDGYANGWQIDSSCVTARMAFTPQQQANVAYIVSAIGCVLLALLALGARIPARLRRRLPPRSSLLGRRVPAPDGARVGRAVTTWLPDGAHDDATLSAGPPVAAAIGLSVGVLTGFMFAIRFGIVAAALTILLLRSGFTIRRLIAIAALAIAAIPVAYIASPAHNFGGFSFDYSLHHIFAHWLGATALCCLIAAGLLQAAAIRRTQQRVAATGSGADRAHSRRRLRRRPLARIES